MKVNDIPYQTAPSIFCLRGQYWVKPWLGSGTPWSPCMSSESDQFVTCKWNEGVRWGPSILWDVLIQKPMGENGTHTPNLWNPICCFHFILMILRVSHLWIYLGVRVGSCNPDSSSTWLTHLWGCAIPFPNANGQFVWWCQNVSNKFSYVFLVIGDNFYGICSIRLKLLVGPINARPSWSDFMAKEPRCL